MKIEEGKFYRTRAGRRVGPVRRNPGDDTYPWLIVRERGVSAYTDQGDWFAPGHVHADDIVAEWVDPGLGELMQAPHDTEAKPDPVRAADPRYGALASVLNDAFQQAASGKGHERHAAGRPFTEQPILGITRMLEGIDGQAYQMMKKAQEAARMVRSGRHAAAEAELFGIINYAAAAVIRVREIAEASPPPWPSPSRPRKPHEGSAAMLSD